jgi:hypothetical protein
VQGVAEVSPRADALQDCDVLLSDSTVEVEKERLGGQGSERSFADAAGAVDDDALTL